MERPIVPVRSGQYHHAGMTLVVADSPTGSIVTVSDGKSSLVWHFRKDGTFSHLAANVGGNSPIADFADGIREQERDRIARVIECHGRFDGLVKKIRSMT